MNTGTATGPVRNWISDFAASGTLVVAPIPAGAKVVAASVDSIDKAREVASEVSFPIGYGVTRDIANTLGAWWEDGVPSFNLQNL